MTSFSFILFLFLFLLMVLFSIGQRSYKILIVTYFSLSFRSKIVKKRRINSTFFFFLPSTGGDDGGDKLFFILITYSSSFLQLVSFSNDTYFTCTLLVLFKHIRVHFFFFRFFCLYHLSYHSFE